MANQVKVAMQQTIITLHEQRWSNRRIARELGLHRETVRRYVNRHKLASGSKAAIPPPGSGGGAVVRRFQGQDGLDIPAQATKFLAHSFVLHFGGTTVPCFHFSRLSKKRGPLYTIGFRGLVS